MDQLQVDGIKDQIWQEIRQAIKLSNQTDSFWDNVKAFAHAVDWKERWIQGLLAAHAVVFLLVMVFRTNTTFLSIVFFALGGFVYFGENINSTAAQHWRQFSSQNYFDDHGVFYGALVAAPSLITLFTVLILILLQASTMMVEVKKRELMHKARARAKADAAAGPAAKKQQ
eukprot:gene8072-8267_t